MAATAGYDCYYANAGNYHSFLVLAHQQKGNICTMWKCGNRIEFQTRSQSSSSTYPNIPQPYFRQNRDKLADYFPWARHTQSSSH